MDSPGAYRRTAEPAAQSTHESMGRPRRPATLTLPDYLRLAASGWLDSPIRSGNRFRHAAGGSFGAHPAADAAWMMDELAVLCTDPALAEPAEDRGSRCRRGSARSSSGCHAAVGHNRYPVAPLVLARRRPESLRLRRSAAANSVVVSLDQARGLAPGSGRIGSSLTVRSATGQRRGLPTTAGPTSATRPAA